MARMMMSCSVLMINVHANTQMSSLTECLQEHAPIVTWLGSQVVRHPLHMLSLVPTSRLTNSGLVRAARDRVSGLEWSNASHESYSSPSSVPSDLVSPSFTAPSGAATCAASSAASFGGV